jgi:hypothetical protein
LEKNRREVDAEERRIGGSTEIDGVNREDRTSIIDAEVNRIGSLETMPIASHVDLPLSSHQGVVGGFAQAVHKRFIIEACSCIRVDETKDGVFTRTSETQTHTDCSRQRSETCVQVCEKEEKDMVPDKMQWSCKEAVGKVACLGRDDDQGDGKSSNEQEARIFNQRAIELSAIHLFFVLI